MGGISISDSNSSYSEGGKFSLKNKIIYILIFVFLSSCKKDTDDQKRTQELVLSFLAAKSLTCQTRANESRANRSFSSSFESFSDFSNSFIVPRNYQDAASHEITSFPVHSGSSAHHAWIYAKGPDCPSWENCNHRAYPTIQLHKDPSAGYHGTIFIEFWVYSTIQVSDGQWISLATFSADPSDHWSRTVLLNVGKINHSQDSYLHLMHVPNQGENTWIYQTNSEKNPLPFPNNQWVKISTCLNLDPLNGFAKVWQDDTLVSTARVAGGCGVLEQAHFGLYASPSLSSGSLYNDDLTIKEVAECPKQGFMIDL